MTREEPAPMSRREPYFKTCRRVSAHEALHDPALSGVCESEVTAPSAESAMTPEPRRLCDSYTCGRWACVHDARTGSWLCLSCQFQARLAQDRLKTDAAQQARNAQHAKYYLTD